MWSNKPPANAPATGDSPEPEGAADLEALGREAVRPGPKQGVSGGLRIVGDIEGREDLFIAGEVNGSVFLPECALQVGPDAKVKANMLARVVEIEGTVVGDLAASQRIVIRSSAVVTGDVVAPQIQIDEGCNFKGSVQMREPDFKQAARTQARTDAVRHKAANE